MKVRSKSLESVHALLFMILAHLYIWTGKYFSCFI